MEDFFTRYGKSCVVLMHPHGVIGREMMTLEDLYQQFRERMERERHEEARKQRVADYGYSVESDYRP